MTSIRYTLTLVLLLSILAGCSDSDKPSPAVPEAEHASPKGGVVQRQAPSDRQASQAIPLENSNGAQSPLDLSIPEAFLVTTKPSITDQLEIEWQAETLFDKLIIPADEDDGFSITGKLFLNVNEEDYLDSEIEGGKINIEIKN